KEMKVTMVVVDLDGGDGVVVVSGWRWWSDDVGAWRWWSDEELEMDSMVVMMHGDGSKMMIGVGGGDWPEIASGAAKI
nr:hypothetical protein [Tanacetum cinerariifolium]